MFRQDYIRRLIDELSKAVARIAGLTAEPARVLEEVEQAKGRLPLVPGLLEQSSVATLVQLVGSKAVLEQLALLYDQQARALEALGLHTKAAQCHERSLRLLQAVRALPDSPTTDSPTTDSP